MLPSDPLSSFAFFLNVSKSFTFALISTLEGIFLAGVVWRHIEHSLHIKKLKVSVEMHLYNLDRKKKMLGEMTRKESVAGNSVQRHKRHK